VSHNIDLRNFELAAVNPSNKNWEAGDLFCFWANTIQTVIGFSLIASLYLIYDLNSGIVLLGSLVASLMIYILVSLVGHPSQKHGIPFPVLLRMSMGLSGAKYIGFIRALVGIFMFGVQTFFISKSIAYLIRIFIYYNFDKQIFRKRTFFIIFFGVKYY
jgi:Cytosine/uracil/thiamine/allantoin permeases